MLDEKRKKWYDSSMDNYTEINQKIAKNLAFYRKAAGYTQAELAEKINYSDKSVSKWESGNGVPDIYILLELAKIYGVSLNDLVGETPVKSSPVFQSARKLFGARLLIMLLSVGIVWLAATLAFVVLELIMPQGDWWIMFLYAVPVSAILCIVFASIWHYRLFNFTAVSLLIWSVITAIFLSLVLYGKTIAIDGANSFLGYWVLYILGIPLQALEVLWVFFRSLFKKVGKKQEKTKQNAEENPLEE